MTADGFPHLTPTGEARMVDVSGKVPSAREAVATGRLVLSPEAIAALRSGTVAKGDALGVARVAGIMATKRVPDLIPLCHQVALSGVDVALEVRDADVVITVTARTTDRTGVEMEALTGVAVAGLALHDMVKALDPAAVLTDIRLERKTGGKSGTWTRP
jgi:cyclic pyranopterin phosphate synthase